MINSFYNNLRKHYFTLNTGLSNNNGNKDNGNHDNGIYLKKHVQLFLKTESNSHFFAVFNVTTYINSKNTNLKYNFVNYPNFQSPQKSIYMCMQ